MTTIEDSDAAVRIVEAGRRRVLARLREALDHQAGTHPDLAGLDPATLDRLAEDAVDRAGSSLWRIALAEGAADEFGVGVSEALGHPAVAAAQQLVDAPAAPVPPPPDAVPVATSQDPAFDEPEADGHVPDPAAHVPDPHAEVDPDGAPAPDPYAESAADADEPLRIPAVHTSGIETLKVGDKDLELRLSDAGLDVIKRSTGIAIGRLEWSEITGVEVEAAKRGLRGRRRSQTLQVRTARGQATFELPGLGDEEVATHLQPMLDRLRASGLLAG